jgi:hypothetical protein
VRDQLLEEALHRAVALCGALVEHAIDRARSWAEQLVGLGPGLTPSGDDFLTGLLVTLAYANRALSGALDWAVGLGQQVAAWAPGRTTRVGEQQLWYAAQGEADEAVARAAMALLWEELELDPAVDGLLRIGSTSGGDILTGMCVASELLDPIACGDPPSRLAAPAGEDEGRIRPLDEVL